MHLLFQKDDSGRVVGRGGARGRGGQTAEQAGQTAGQTAEQERAGRSGWREAGRISRCSGVTSLGNREPRGTRRLPAWEPRCTLSPRTEAVSVPGRSRRWAPGRSGRRRSARVRGLRKRRGLGALFPETVQLHVSSLAAAQPAPSLSHARCHHPY